MAVNRTNAGHSQGSSAAEQARRAGDAQQNAAAKEGVRQAQRATTYNGTLFTNTNQTQNSNQAAQRKFANLARNKKRANVARAKRNAVSGGGDDDGGDAQLKHDDMDALNGGRGGGGGRGREQEQHEAPMEAGAAGGGDGGNGDGPRPTSARIAPPSQLDTIAAKFETGHEMQRAEAVRNAWHDSVRQLFETAGKSESGPWAARLAALIVDLSQIEMKIGPVGAGGISALRELTQHAAKGAGSESFHHILPLAMLRASYKPGKARRERGGAITQSVRAGIVGRTEKAAKGEKA